jgi:uncharacterized membrane protein
MYAYSLIPIFAERVTPIGEWKASSQAHGRPEEVGERFHAIRRMYATQNIDECIRILDTYGINYVYIGELERELYADGINKFKNHPKFFTLVYSQQNVEIFFYDTKLM